MAWWQDFPISIAAKKDSQIRTPQDLAGKKIGVPILSGASYIGLRALLGSAGLKESDIFLETIGFNQVEALVTDQEQGVVVYANNEPIQLKARGYDVDVVRVADYVELASNGLITNETTLAQNPELVKNMISATLRGIADAIADSDEAFEISKKYVEGLDGENGEIQKQVLLASIESWKTETPGLSHAQAWENMRQVLLDIGLITQPLDLSKAYTNEFVPSE